MNKNLAKAGGAAFPRPCAENQDEYNSAQDGMSLRDYFAAKAMQSIVSTTDGNPNEFACARIAYAVADAMLKAREE